MRWRAARESDNVEDRRGQRPRRGATVGIGGLLAIVAISYLTGADPRQLLSPLGGIQSSTSQVPRLGLETGSVDACDTFGRGTR